MAQATRTETYDVSAENFYKTIVDYQGYVGSIPGVESIVVLEK